MSPSSQCEVPSHSGCGDDFDNIPGEVVSLVILGTCGANIGTYRKWLFVFGSGAAWEGAFFVGFVTGWPAMKRLDPRSLSP